jgi:hypothetical protein
MMLPITHALFTQAALTPRPTPIAAQLHRPWKYDKRLPRSYGKCSIHGQNIPYLAANATKDR